MRRPRLLAEVRLDGFIDDAAIAVADVGPCGGGPSLSTRFAAPALAGPAAVALEGPL